MASGNSVLHTLAMGQLGNQLVDPGAGGKIEIGDQSLVAVVFTTNTATGRILPDGLAPGQLAICINASGGTANVTDAGATLSLELADNEVGLCIYTGETDARWRAVVLKGTAT